MPVCMMHCGVMSNVEHTVSLDGSARMIDRARRRASGAEFQQALEPEAVREVLAMGYEPELRAARFEVIDTAALAHGTASLVVAQSVAV